MSVSLQPASTCTPSRGKTDAYIYTVIPIAQNGLAAITSANELLLLDRYNLARSPVLSLERVPQQVSCLVAGDDAGHTVICAGSDGYVSTFDVRSQDRVSHFKTDRAVTALTCNTLQIALGTELSHHQAVVSVWDRRQNKQHWQNAENNDDITALDFHPSRPHILLCGGDDGQVSVFDTLISDEDESLLQGVNYGPIHKAGFLGEQRFFALTSDQNLAVHPLSTQDDAEDPQPVLFGDLRPLVPCEYVIDVFRSGNEYVIAAGSNVSESRVDMIELQDATTPGVDPQLRKDARYRLEGGHGEEVVRSLFVDGTTGTIFTAGEDGHITAFQHTESAITPTSTPSTKSSKAKKGSEARYKPY